MLRQVIFVLFSLVVLSGCAGKKNCNLSGSASQGLITDFEQNVGDRVFFGLNQHNLTKESKSQLTKQATWLKDHKDVSVTIAGHCDERGTREYNLALGERRASSVKRFLSCNGVDANRIDTISYGKERPAEIGTGEEVWSKNRRAVTVIK